MIVLLYRLSNCSQLMVPLARIERATSPLPRECSTTELQRRKNRFEIADLKSFFPGPAPAGAGEGNRTLVVSLEGFCSTIELHPRFTTEPLLPPSAHTANQRRKKLGGGGWIRTNVGARPTDLQSAPFNHSGTPPNETEDYARFRPGSQTKFDNAAKHSHAPAWRDRPGGPGHGRKYATRPDPARRAGIGQ